MTVCRMIDLYTYLLDDYNTSSNLSYSLIGRPTLHNRFEWYVRERISATALLTHLMHQRTWHVEPEIPEVSLTHTVSHA